jgi:transposase
MKDRKKVELLRQQKVLNRGFNNVKEPLFNDNAFFDPKDLLQVKYEMLRVVTQKEKSITAASESFGFSRPSFYEARKLFLKEGIMGLVPKKTGPRHRHKLTEEIISFAKSRLEQDGNLNINDLAVEIEEKFSAKIHPRSIKRVCQNKKKRKSQGGKTDRKQ